MITATDISVFLERFSHDNVIKLNAVVTSRAGEVLLGRHRASLWSSATHRGLSFRICPHGCPCNGCTDASLSLLIHSHPCLCQGNGSPLSVLLYVKPHLPSVLSEIQHATQLIRSEEQLIFFLYFPLLASVLQSSEK